MKDAGQNPFVIPEARSPIRNDERIEVRYEA